MRRMLIGLVAVAVTAAALGTAQAVGGQAKAIEVTICHRTLSGKRAYIRIVVRTKAGLRAHTRHAQDIIPAPAHCPTKPMTSTQGGQELTAVLTGAVEVPPGDLDGTGNATVRLTPGMGRLCFTISVSNIQLPASAAHVHVGGLGVAGNVVVPLTAPGADGKSSGCVNVVRTLVAAILGNPSGYYVNVHTTDHPAGAVRGQLNG